MQKLAVRRVALVAATFAVLALALPAAAIPYCWNCTCSHKCTTRCWDGSGEDVCGNWLCIGHCEPPLFTSVAVAGAQTDLLAALTGGDDADCGEPQERAADGATARVDAAAEAQPAATAPVED